MKIKEVVEALESFAPLPLQEDYDNAGLQIGLTEGEVSGVLLCLDVTEDVIAEAIKKECNLIVAHHPLLFRGLKCVSDANYVQRCVRDAILGGVSVYAAHTNLDNARGGVSFAMAECLGLEDTNFLQPQGEGGSGIIGMLPNTLPVSDFLYFVKNRFEVNSIRHNAYKKNIQRVALCGGSGDFLIDEALRQGADAFITGEVGYHRFFGLEDNLLVVSLGHYESEKCAIGLLKNILNHSLPTLRTEITQIDTNPVKYF